MKREWTSLLFKSNTTSNKLQENGTVSQRSRHRSNRTQKAVPSAVAGHQFPQFGCIGLDVGIFPATEVVTIQASA